MEVVVGEGDGAEAHHFIDKEDEDCEGEADEGKQEGGLSLVEENVGIAGPSERMQVVFHLPVMFIIK